jgi:hypothetical protein
MILHGLRPYDFNDLTTKAHYLSRQSRLGRSLSPMKAPRHILKLTCRLACEPQTAMGYSTLGSRVLPSRLFLRAERPSSNPRYQPPHCADA